MSHKKEASSADFRSEPIVVFAQYISGDAQAYFSTARAIFWRKATLIS